MLDYTGNRRHDLRAIAGFCGLLVQPVIRQADAISLLDRAKSILSRWDRLHQISVDIGRFEKISDSGVVDSEIGQCRRIIEQADRLCADIDKITTKETA